MTIELVKEVSPTGSVTYYVNVDGKYQTGTARGELEDAMMVYEATKDNYNKARTEVLIREDI